MAGTFRRSRCLIRSTCCLRCAMHPPNANVHMARWAESMARARPIPRRTDHVDSLKLLQMLSSPLLALLSRLLDNLSPSRNTPFSQKSCSPCSPAQPMPRICLYLLRVDLLYWERLHVLFCLFWAFRRRRNPARATPRRHASCSAQWSHIVMYCHCDARRQTTPDAIQRARRPTRCHICPRQNNMRPAPAMVSSSSSLMTTPIFA